jgi:hypothetical protein
MGVGVLLGEGRGRGGEDGEYGSSINQTLCKYSTHAHFTDFVERKPYICENS